MSSGKSKNTTNIDMGNKYSPRYVKVSKRPSDGKTSTIYGNSRNSNKKIEGPHGHTVQGKSGNIEYSRSVKGDVRKDDK